MKVWLAPGLVGSEEGRIVVTVISLSDGGTSAEEEEKRGLVLQPSKEMRNSGRKSSSNMDRMIVPPAVYSYR